MKSEGSPEDALLKRRGTGRMMESEGNLQKLPIGWEWARIGDILEPSKERADPTEIDEIAYIGLEHIEKDTGKLLGHGKSGDVRSLKAKFFKDDLLYGKLRPYLNKVYVADFDGVCSTDILVFPKNKYISNKYLQFRFLQEDFVRYANQNATGVQHPRIDFKKLANFKIPLAPLPEQRRIVARIEELFSRLDAGVEALQSTKAQLQRYRQAILKVAIVGRLTEEWREAHPEVEPAEKLLRIMLKERRERWEKKQQEKFIISGRKNLKNPRSNYKEPILITTLKFTKLPTSWCWASAEQCTTTITDGEHVTPERSESGILLLSARNIQDGYLSLDNVDFVPNNIYEKLKQRLIIEPGDVLLSCSGSVGRSCVAPENLEFALVRSVAVLKPLMKMGNYLSYAIRSPLLQLQINERITQTAQANIFQNKIKTLMFPLPPLSEQQIIVQELDYRFSIIDEFSNNIDKNIKISNNLRQSIFKSAFKDMLDSQNPNDEPASTILAQINEDRIKLSNSKNKPKRKKVIMSKSRRSLYDVLAEADTKLTPEELFDKSGHDIKSIDEFYEELREEIFIKSRVKEIRLNKADVYLKVIRNENI